jgi:hypothetical protein
VLFVALACSVDFQRAVRRGAVVPQAEGVAVDGEDAVLDGEIEGLTAEACGGDEDGEVRAEVGLGAEKVTQAAGRDGALRGVALALDDQCAAVRRVAKDVGAVVTGSADSPDVGATVAAGERCDVIHELGPGRGVRLGQRAVPGLDRVLTAPAPVRVAVETVRAPKQSRPRAGPACSGYGQQIGPDRRPEDHQKNQQECLTG